MLTCEVCGGNDFEKDAGYMYCSQCQTQTQEYYEQECEVIGPATGKKQSAPGQKKKRKDETQSLTVEDCWTSWDAFNCILHGMTSELKESGLAPASLETAVLKLWACYLQKCEVAFMSTVSEKKPKFQKCCHKRDLKVLYGVKPLVPRKKRKRQPSKTSSASTVSALVSVQKKRLMKKKLVDSFYTEYSGLQKVDKLANETIDSLKRSSSPDTDVTSGGRGRRPASSVPTSTDNMESKKLEKFGKKWNSLKRGKLHYVCKSKLLEVIHLALLQCGSQIQLSDLLRFIREGHLSFAKVTHFLPDEIKLSNGDACFLESLADHFMPTHLKQREVGRTVAKFLHLEEFPAPDIESLISRYCVDLNLPDKIGHYSAKVFHMLNIRNLGRLGNEGRIPNYEAMAIALIIFIIKLFFGLDGKTEWVLSDLAQKINSVVSGVEQEKLFVFSRWQKHLELRKSVIEYFHYPVEEKLARNTFGNSTNFIDMLLRESKDDFREDRFKVYNQYYVNPKLLNAVKNALNALMEPWDRKSIVFPPSLTPNTCYLDIILEEYDQGNSIHGKSDNQRNPDLNSVALDLLKENFSSCKIDFLLSPETYAELLEENDFTIVRKSKNDLTSSDFLSELCEDSDEAVDESVSERCISGTEVQFPSISSKNVVFINNPFDYWLAKLSKSNEFLFQFRENFLDKMPPNFKWIVSEFSMMLEMNAREICKELQAIEKGILCKFKDR